MNLAAATTYELSIAPALFVVRDTEPPTNSFVSGIVQSLCTSFALDDGERELTELVLFGRPIGAIARRLGVTTRAAQARVQGLYATTCASGREQLFEIGLRLRAARELSTHVLARRAAC